MQYKKEFNIFNTAIIKMTSECIRKAGDRIYSVKISPYSNHSVIVDESF